MEQYKQHKTKEKINIQKNATTTKNLKEQNEKAERKCFVFRFEHVYILEITITTLLQFKFKFQFTNIKQFRTKT